MEANDVQNLLEDLRRVVRLAIDSHYRSVDEFASFAGMKQSTVARFLSGDRSSKLATFIQIAAALDLDLGPLFPFGKPWNLAEKKALVFGEKQRRKKVTVHLSETSVVEIKRDPKAKKALLELKLG